MFDLVTLILYGFLLGIGNGDLIGFNRLGNNVHSHNIYRNEIVLANYEHQITRWMAKNNGRRLSKMRGPHHQMETATRRMWRRASNIIPPKTYKQEMIEKQMILPNR